MIIVIMYMFWLFATKAGLPQTHFAYPDFVHTLQKLPYKNCILLTNQSKKMKKYLHGNVSSAIFRTVPETFPTTLPKPIPKTIPHSHDDNLIIMRIQPAKC